MTVLPGKVTTLASTQMTATSDSPVWGFTTLHTSSGQSLGSLAHYSMDWNSADMSEVNSMQAQPIRHPAGPSVQAQKIHALKVAVQEVA